MQYLLYGTLLNTYEWIHWIPITMRSSPYDRWGQRSAGTCTGPWSPQVVELWVPGISLRDQGTQLLHSPGLSLFCLYLPQNSMIPEAENAFVLHITPYQCPTKYQANRKYSVQPEIEQRNKRVEGKRKWMNEVMNERNNQKNHDTD